MKTFLFAVLAVAVVGCGAPQEKCDPRTFGGPFCVPDGGVAAAGQKLTLEVVDQCNGSCGRTTLSCVVTRDAGTLTLSIAGEVCEPPPNVSCSLACALTRKSCDVPALEEGDYTVVSPNQTSQVLKVRDGGSSSGCAATLF